MPQSIVVLSDSTGELGERIVRALTSQFPKESFEFKVFSFIEKDRELDRIFRDIKSAKPIIFHTTIFKDMKMKIVALAKKNRLAVHDLTGGAMIFLEKASGLKSKIDPASLHELNQEYEERIRSLSFTVEHDDGLGESSWEEADIVLLGVSRTSKTPTSIFLANKGYKVANIPIVKEVPVYEKLKKHPRIRAVGLIIDPFKLREIRLKRAIEKKIPGSDYTGLRSIEEELKLSHNLFLELGCPIVDVTNHAIEETAALVLKALHLR
jgi:hypothetical protein